MKVKIKRLDKDLPLPMYETSGSVGFDLLCRESVTIASQTVALIPANVIVETPPGYMLMVTLRSSTPRKKGLLIPHGVGLSIWTTAAKATRSRSRSIISRTNLLQSSVAIRLRKGSLCEWTLPNGQRCLKWNRRHAVGLAARTTRIDGWNN